MKRIGDERKRNLETLNFDILDAEHIVGKYGMPFVKRTNYVPDHLIPFNYILTDRGVMGWGHAVHFFIDDYQFERIWKTPERYVNLLRSYQGVLTPDFSTYTDMPLALQIYNVYRSRLMGQYLQRARCTVIPTLQFSDENSFEFCFDGIDPGGTVATSTLGCAKDKSIHEGWRKGMDEAIRRLEPTTIICYGAKIDYDFQGIETVWFPHPIKKWSKYSTRKERRTWADEIKTLEGELDQNQYLSEDKPPQ